MSNRDLIQQIQNHIDNVDDPNASLLVARKLLVRIVAALQAHEWQPIETAPEDKLWMEVLRLREIVKTGDQIFKPQPPGDKDEPLEA